MANLVDGESLPAARLAGRSIVMTGKGFLACAICGADDWSPVYRGPVRDGAFGRRSSDTIVARCGGCGVERLDETVCPEEGFYETEAYRRKLGQGLSTGAHFADADGLQRFAMELLASHSLRDKNVADVGCAGGSFLDHVAGLAERKIAIEPCGVYHDSLAERGYAVFPYAADAVAGFRGQVDLATTFQVIEHVQNPRDFLAGIRPLLAPNGRLLISTPNRRDILMDLLPEDFPAFFYRVVHRWYFDANALADCARRAGFEVESVQFVHRYGLSNALAWLRDRRPSGHTRLNGIDPAADRSWRAYLEDTGQADCLYMFLKPGPSA